MKVIALAFLVVLFLSVICLVRTMLFIDSEKKNSSKRNRKVGRYEPTWDSLDVRPLPSWYDDAKLGIFCHWGVYSVPAFGSEWFWWYWKGDKSPAMADFMRRHYPSGTTYADFAREFTAEDLDAGEFANIVSSSGARYFVLTSKHHEGYTLWPSKTSWNWNALDIGPKRDLVAELAAAIRSRGLHFGLYFSQYDWFHPLYLADKVQNSTDFVQQVSWPQQLELVNSYEPDVVWSDGDWEQPEGYWRSKEFLAWLYNDSPVRDRVVVNDRWGVGTMGHHGGFLTHSDHFDPGHLMARKWENCLTLDASSWGYRRNIKAKDVRSVKDLIGQLARTISCNGNMLLNIGPDNKGRIIPIFQERLSEFGAFVNANQEAIFGTRPWIHQNDSSNIWYTSRIRDGHSKRHHHRVYNAQTQKSTIVYAFILDIPPDGQINLPSVKTTEMTRVALLGTSYTKIPFQGDVLHLDISHIPWQNFPSTEALVFRIEYAADDNHSPQIHYR